MTRKRIIIKIILFVILCIASLYPFFSPKTVYAAEVKTDVHAQLEENVNEQLGGLDTSMFDKFIYSLDEDSYGIFGANSFKEKLHQIISGDIGADGGSVFQIIASIVLAQFANMLPLLASVVAISILGNLLTMVKPQTTKTAGIIHFVCYLAIVLIVLTITFRLIDSLCNTITVLNEFMNVVFPLLLTLMTASGSTMSSSIYQPATALLCGIGANIIIGVIVPLFIASIILSVVSNLTDNVKVAKFADFFKSTGKWITGIMFTVFIAFLSIQGITASTYDSISVRAIKYAVGNSIPFVGGYIKEGFDLVLGSTVLIKNAVGVAGLIMLICFVVAPILDMIVCSLGLKLTAAVCEPVCEKKVPAFLQSASSNFSLLIAAFASLAFMFFITIMLLLMTSNAVLI